MGKAVPCLISQLTLPLTLWSICDRYCWEVDIFSTWNKYKTEPCELGQPAYSVNVEKHSTTQMENIEAILKLSSFPSFPQIMLTISIFIDFSFFSVLFKNEYELLLCSGRKITKLSRPDKVRLYGKPTSLQFDKYPACLSIKHASLLGSMSIMAKGKWCYYLMACRTVIVLLTPKIGRRASDSTITESSLILLTLVSNPRSVLGLICFTGLSGILIKQCSEAAY